MDLVESVFRATYEVAVARAHGDCDVLASEIHALVLSRARSARVSPAIMLNAQMYAEDEARATFPEAFARKRQNAG